jgi:hypothetical protein
VFNLFERFPWIESSTDILGNTLKYEIYKDSSLIMSKFIFFDYFSYENYFIVRINLMLTFKGTTGNCKS